MAQLTKRAELPLSEVMEAQGHLIDSHIMEQIFDTVVEYGGRFEVEHFSVGRTNSEPSRLRIKVEAPTQADLEKMMMQLIGLGCAPVDSGEAELGVAERDTCAPEDFYSTTNQVTQVRYKGQWLEVSNQRMDAMVVINEIGATCRRLRDIKAGDKISSERQVETSVGQTAAIMEATRREGKKIVAVAGPVVVHTGGGEALSRLIRGGWIDALLAGNALAVHDIESALLGTSLGVRKSDGRLEHHGHRNHMRAINAINHAGGIRQAVESGRLTQGVMYEAVKANIPFVLAGSLRDDGPLPDVMTDMNEAQDAYAAQLKDAGVVLCLSSMLHSIAAGNMLPAWVKVVCVDINPAVHTKVSDRGTGHAVGVVTDVGLFLDLLSKKLL